MSEYKDLKTGKVVKLSEKNFFPSTGAKTLIKTRPPLAKEVKTD